MLRARCRFICAMAPEKDVHRFPSLLTVFANDKAVDSVHSRKTGESYTLGAISGQTQPTKRSPYVWVGPSPECEENRVPPKRFGTALHP